MDQQITFSISPMTVVWVLLAALLVVGVILLLQVVRFMKSLTDRVNQAEEILSKTNELIDQTSKLIDQTTEITERVNNSYKQVNTIVDYAATGISNFVMSKFDK